MADFAVWTIHSHNYGGAENVLVVLNRFRGTLNNKVGRNRIVAFGNVINFAHDFLLRGGALKNEVEEWSVKARGARPAGLVLIRADVMRTQIQAGLKLNFPAFCDKFGRRYV